MLSNITIREMRKDDIEQIMKIESVSFGNFFWTKEAFAQEVDNKLGVYFVAENEKKEVVGYCGFWLIADEAHITTIAVKPEIKRQGLGERMLQAMIDAGYKKKVKWFTLEVRASNFAAQGLYFKYNFKNLGLRRKYYQDNDEDAMIMWTENIWDSSFKNHYEKMKSELLKRIRA